jgi:hypothetical protein
LPLPLPLLVALASHRTIMNVVRYMVFLVLGMLSTLLSSLTTWFWG